MLINGFCDGCILFITGNVILGGYGTVAPKKKEGTFAIIWYFIVVVIVLHWFMIQNKL